MSSLVLHAPRMGQMPKFLAEGMFLLKISGWTWRAIMARQWDDRASIPYNAGKSPQDHPECRPPSIAPEGASTTLAPGGLSSICDRAQKTSLLREGQSRDRPRGRLAFG